MESCWRTWRDLSVDLMELQSTDSDLSLSLFHYYQFILHAFSFIFLFNSPNISIFLSFIAFYFNSTITLVFLFHNLFLIPCLYFFIATLYPSGTTNSVEFLFFALSLLFPLLSLHYNFLYFFCYLFLLQVFTNRMYFLLSRFLVLQFFLLFHFPSSCSLMGPHWLIYPILSIFTTT